MDCAAWLAHWALGGAAALLAPPARPARPALLVLARGAGVEVWDLARDARLHLFQGLSPAVQLAADPAGRRLAACARDQSIRVWDLDSGALLCAAAEHLFSVHALAWDPAGRYLAAGSTGPDVRLYRAETGAHWRFLGGHAGPVRCLAAHPDGDADLLASGSDDCTVRLWRWSTGEPRGALAGHADSVRALAASARWLLSAARDQTVRVWSWRGVCARVLRGAGVPAGPDALAWRGARLVAAGDEGAPRVWDTGAPDPAAWDCAGPLGPDPHPFPLPHPHAVAVLASGRVACAARGAPLLLHALRAPRERRRIRRPAARL